MTKYKCTKNVYYSDTLVAFAGDIVEIRGKVLHIPKTGTKLDNANYILNMIKAKILVPVDKSEQDKVNHPSHYTWLKEKCGIEVIDITRHLDFDKGNAVKYLLRSGYKAEEGYTAKDKEIEDLKKAIWYINDKIKMLENDKQ